MARAQLDLPDEMNLETPYGSITVMPYSDVKIHLDHADVDGLTVDGRRVGLAGWWLAHTEEGWEVLRRGAQTYPERGRHDPELQDRLAGEIEVLFEAWALEHQPELAEARRVYLTNEASRLERGIAAAEQKLIEDRAQLAEITAEIGPQLSPLEAPVTAAELPTRHDFGH